MTDPIINLPTEFKIRKITKQDELEVENAVLRAALSWYASPRNWARRTITKQTITQDVWVPDIHGWVRAQAALGEDAQAAPRPLSLQGALAILGGEETLATAMGL